MLEKWRKAGKTMPVLILTARDRWSDKVAGFDAGADDYLAKPFYTEELLARLRALLRRAAGIATADIEIGPLRIDTRASRVTLDGNPVKLTSLEYRLLAYLAHHRGKVVSRTELVEHLYDQDFDRDSNTIEVFVGRLRKKLDAGLIQTVRGLGYSLEDPATGRHGGFRLNSLAARLIAAAAVWTMLGLAVGGVVLSNAFRRAAENSFDAALTADMDGLIAAAEPDPDGGVVLQDRFLNHHFDRVYSGLYYQIKPPAGSRAVRFPARCSTRTSMPCDEMRKGALTWGHAAGPENQHLRVVSRRVEFPIARHRAQRHRAYTFLVAGDMSAVDRQTRGLQRHADLVVPAAGPGAGGGDPAAGAHRPVAAAARQRGAGPHPRRQGAAAGRAFPRRDRAACRPNSIP